MKQKGLYLFHKGEPVIPLRHKDCKIKLCIKKVILLKKEQDRVAKEIEKSLAKYFGNFDKPKIPEKKAWSVS